MTATLETPAPQTQAAGGARKPPVRIATSAPSPDDDQTWLDWAAYVADLRQLPAETRKRLLQSEWR